MENEYREREEPKVRYEQQAGKNPMDAVGIDRDRSAGKNNRSDAKDKKSKSGQAGKDRSGSVGTANEYRVREDRDLPDTANTTKASKPKKSGAARRPNLLVQVLNGDILARDFVLNNLTFIFFILFLLLLVVGKGYYGKQLAKDIDKLQEDVNASTAEYIENKAKLEESTTRYRLVEMLERRGLKESLKPAKVIRIKRPEK